MSVYSRNPFNPIFLPGILVCNTEINIYAVNVDLSSCMNLNIFGVYHPPSSNIIESCEFISESILTKFGPNDPINFGGNFNINLADEHASHILCDTIHSQIFIPLITISMRITDHIELKKCFKTNIIWLPDMSF